MTCEIIYYSATDTTANIMKAFSKGLNGELTFSKITMSSHENAVRSDADLLVFSSPVYGRRIPVRIMKCFEQKCAEGKMVVGIAVYGNITYGASLKQLYELAKKHNCSFIGAGAFIAEHTYSVEDAQIAGGRPNANDLEQAAQFGLAVQEKINRGDKADIALPPSNYPLFLTKLPEDTVRPVVKKPVIIGDCNSCGVCAKFCPSKAIASDTLEIDESKCIRCFACVKKCPRKARRGELIIKGLRFPFSHIGSKKKELIWRV
jgi:ferredoxin